MSQATTAPRPIWPALHGIIFLLALVLAACLPGLGWPRQFVVPLCSYAGVVMVVAPLRRTMPPVRVGRIDGIGVAAAVVLAILTTLVLLGFQAWFSPDVTELAAKLPMAMLGNVLIAALCIGVGNAVLEELLCRWVLYDAIRAEWGVAVAIVTTSLFFGLGHLQGYPPGPLGAVLAGCYGLGLALLRWWSGGLALPMCCHVGADATILWIIHSTQTVAHAPHLLGRLV